MFIATGPHYRAAAGKISQNEFVVRVIILPRRFVPSQPHKLQDTTRGGRYKPASFPPPCLRLTGIAIGPGKSGPPGDPAG
jgi:hypothetical protein